VRSGLRAGLLTVAKTQSQIVVRADLAFSPARCNRTEYDDAKPGNWLRRFCIMLTINDLLALNVWKMHLTPSPVHEDTVVGWYYQGNNHGRMRTSTGEVTSIDYPGAAATWVFGISDPTGTGPTLG